MSYRKQISYLELQENGQRIRSAGYARLESLDKEEILTVQLNGQEVVPGKGIPLYLQWETGEQQLCEMTIDRGRASWEKRIPLEKERERIRKQLAKTQNTTKLEVKKPKKQHVV